MRSVRNGEEPPLTLPAKVRERLAEKQSSRSSSSALTGAASKIVNGRDARKGSVPWMVSLQYTHGDDDSSPAYHFCGGSLIAPNLVLTAAHCVGDGVQQVRIGATDLAADAATDGSDVIGVKAVWRHPYYDDYTTTNDIAILELESDSSHAPGKKPAQPKPQLTTPTTTAVPPSPMA